MNRKNRYFLQDPITARRVLQEGYTWIGGSDNTEQPYYLGDFSINLRDLRCRILMLRQELEYLKNTRLIIPFKNKYLTNTQVLSELEQGILKHNKGFVKIAVAGVDYVDFNTLTNAKLCAIEGNVDATQHKFINVTDLTPTEIHTYFNNYDQHIEEYNEFKIEYHEHIEEYIEYKNTINNNITNINNNITSIDNSINQINNDITTINNNITNMQETIQNIEEGDIVEINTEITNINNEINSIQNNITNINNNINNIQNNVTNINNQLQTINEWKETTNEWKLEVDAQLELINNITAQITGILTAIANLQALIIALQNDITLINQRIDSLEAADCIAWSLANDRLVIEW